MANHEYKILSEDAIKYLCGLIRDLASVSEGIDNLNLADDKTFSNIYIKNLIDKCLEDANAEAEKLVGALTHLTCEETAIQPTLDNSEINVIYLYSANGNPPYQQFLKISEDKLVDLGSTSISLEDYIKAADVAKDYATKVELKAVTDKIGTTTLTTTDTTITGAIEEVKGIADGKVDKTSIVTALGDSVTDDQVTSALLAKTELGKINANLGELSTYSTEETKVGTWIDGKPIYRRSLEIPLDGEPQKTLEFIYQGVTALEGGEDISIYINQITPGVNLSEWNIDTMVKVYGHITDYTDTTKTEKNVDIPYPVTFNAQAYVTGWYNYKTKLYVVRVGEQYANRSTAFLTFEYTKV